MARLSTFPQRQPARPEEPALAHCIDCGREISSSATTCPHCGRPWPLPGQKESAEDGVLLASIVGPVVIFGVFIALVVLFFAAI